MLIPQYKVKTTNKEQEICIIFSRYPRPGVAKTRLIPCLGRQGAAELQRRMTEKVAGEAACLATKAKVHVELAMADTVDGEMAAWLGRRFPWQAQVGEDLGARMVFAFAQAFERGFQRAVVVGADCPGVSTDILAQAFYELRQNELVLGPTEDGGYYLIGLSRINPNLFTHISWGSDKVLAQTMARARKASMQTALLVNLADVDRPEDLDALPPALLDQLP